MQLSRVNFYWKITYWILVVSPSFENEDWSKTSLITQNRIYFQVNIEEVKERYMHSNINIDFEDTGVTTDGEIFPPVKSSAPKT